MRFIAGIVTTPVVSTLETTLPETEPIRPLAKIDTLAGPPRTEPNSAKARLLKKCAAPVYCSTAPNITKPITSSPKARIGMPSTLSLLKRSGTTRSSARSAAAARRSGPACGRRTRDTARTAPPRRRRRCRRRAAWLRAASPSRRRRPTPPASAPCTPSLPRQDALRVQGEVAEHGERGREQQHVVPGHERRAARACCAGTRRNTLPTSSAHSQYRYAVSRSVLPTKKPRLRIWLRREADRPPTRSAIRTGDAPQRRERAVARRRHWRRGGVGAGHGARRRSSPARRYRVEAGLGQRRGAGFHARPARTPRRWRASPSSRRPTRSASTFWRCEQLVVVRLVRRRSTCPFPSRSGWRRRGTGSPRRSSAGPTAQPALPGAASL